MKNIFLILFVLLGCNSLSFAQINKKNQQIDFINTPVNQLLIDSAKVDLNKMLINPQHNSIEIPNAYKGKKLNNNITPNNLDISPDDTIILNKKLDPNGSVEMPNREKLEPFGRNNKLDSIKLLKNNNPLERK